MEHGVCSKKKKTTKKNGSYLHERTAMFARVVGGRGGHKNCLCVSLNAYSTWFVSLVYVVNLKGNSFWRTICILGLAVIDFILLKLFTRAESKRSWEGCILIFTSRAVKVPHLSLEGYFPAVTPHIVCKSLLLLSSHPPPPPPPSYFGSSFRQPQCFQLSTDHTMQFTENISFWRWSCININRSL